MLRTARDDGLDIDAFTFYSAVLQGWQGASAAPADAAASMLRGLGSGELPLTSDLRAWNLLCETALDDQSDALVALRGDDEDEAAAAWFDGPEMEEAMVEEATAEEVVVEEVMVEDAMVEEVEAEEVEAGARAQKAEADKVETADIGAVGAEAEAAAEVAAAAAAEAAAEAAHSATVSLIDGAYRRAVAEGALAHWVADGSALDLHGFSVPMARAAMRHMMSELLLGSGPVESGERLAEPEGGAAEGGATEGGATEGGVAEGGAAEGGAAEGGAVEREEELAEREERLGEAGLLVITGRGKGSGLDAVLGPAVLHMLAHEAHPPIPAAMVPGNDGRLRIDGAGLRNWVAANRA
jgi:DNA-nicking Smr family endonuclease